MDIVVKMKGFYHQYIYSNKPYYSVIIEDEGHVAYAYLLKKKKIIAHLWLYNQLNQMDNSSLESGDTFVMPLENIKPGFKLNPIINQEDVYVNWNFSEDSKTIEASIFIRGEFLGNMNNHDKHGCSKAIINDCPGAYRFLFD